MAHDSHLQQFPEYRSVTFTMNCGHGTKEKVDQAVPPQIDEACRQADPEMLTIANILILKGYSWI